MATTAFKISNKTDQEIKIRLIKRSGATATLNGGDNPTSFNDEEAVGFCLSAVPQNILFDDQGNTLASDDGYDLGY